MNKRGSIVSWNDAKGYGFIEPDAGGRKLFVHISELHGLARKRAVGTSVIYTEMTDTQGRLNATDVRSTGFRLAPGVATLAFIVAALFLAAMAAIVQEGRLPPVLPWLYGILSVVTFSLYASDKASARKGGQRVPEDSLHLLALCGGWPGALYAQQLLRHKSRKLSFRIWFWITVLINIAALGYLLTEPGQWLAQLLTAGGQWLAEILTEWGQKALEALQALYAEARVAARR